MSWSVYRQCSWPNSQFTVMITEDDYESNPDMLPDTLMVKYPHEGEGERYVGPVAAADAAIRIATAWRKDEQHVKIYVACGGECGFTAPFESGAEVQLIAWARGLRQICAVCEKTCTAEIIEVEHIHLCGSDVVCSMECKAQFYSDEDEDD